MHPVRSSSAFVLHLKRSVPVLLEWGAQKPSDHSTFLTNIALWIEQDLFSLSNESGGQGLDPSDIRNAMKHLPSLSGTKPFA